MKIKDELFSNNLKYIYEICRSKYCRENGYYNSNAY